MIRVLHVLGQIPIGGVGAFLLNTLENIDKQKIESNIVMFNSIYSSNFNEKMEAMGIRTYCFSSYLNIKDFLNIRKEFKRYLLENEPYDIIHIHSPNLGIFILPVAKKLGIKVRILHSHSIRYSTNKKKVIRNYLLQFPNKFYTTHGIACSEEAGKFLFKKQPFEIICNGIDIDKFAYSQEIRDLVRGKDNNKIIVGHIGNFLDQKNHSYLIEIFNRLYKINNNYELWLVGDGPLRNEIEDKVGKLKLNKAVRFLGRREDVHDLMQAFDVFLLPSLFEGLGIVLIEAQAAGLKCFASNTIPTASRVSDNIMFLDINNNMDKWVENIINTDLQHRINVSKVVRSHGYDIKDSSRKLQELYIGTYERKE